MSEPSKARLLVDDGSADDPADLLVDDGAAFAGSFEIPVSESSSESMVIGDWGVVITGFPADDPTDLLVDDGGTPGLPGTF